MCLNKKFRKRIIVTFSISILFALLAGMIIADKNTERIGFSNHRDFLEFENNFSDKQYIEINILGIDKKWDFSKEYQEINLISKNVTNIILKYKDNM